MKKATILKKHIVHFLQKSYRDNIPALSGQSAFFLILSAAPLLLFVFSMVFILTGAEPQLDDLMKVIPETGFHVSSALRYIVQFAQESVQRAGTGMAIITAATTLWSAGRGMYCITEGISRIYEVPNKRLWLTKRILSMGYTVLMLLTLLLALAVMVIDLIFTGSITALFGGERWVFRLVFFAFYLVFGFLQALVMSLALKLYLRNKVRNKRYRTIRALLPGMLLTVLAWNLLSFGVVVYIRNFAASSIYGSLSSIFVMMIWIYFMMYILLYGIQLNYIYRAQFSCLSLSRKRREALKAAAAKKSEKDAENFSTVSDKRKSM